MILDYSDAEARNEAACRPYDIFDAMTGEKIKRVWYADDEAGIVRRYIFNANDQPQLWDKRTRKLVSSERLGNGARRFTDADGNIVPGDCLSIAWIEERRPIWIVPKDDASLHQETKRDPTALGVHAMGTADPYSEGCRADFTIPSTVWIAVGDEKPVQVVLPTTQNPNRAPANLAIPLDRISRLELEAAANKPEPETKPGETWRDRPPML